MDDRALVAALVSGDPRGLEGAYLAYADRLYTYCRGMLRDPDAAADALHDTFLLAGQRAGQLRDPERLRPWLYAIARNECLRLLRGRARSVPLEEAGQVSDPATGPATDPDAGMRASEVRELVWSAADGLNPGDREVFELSVRHDLAADEVAGMLGVSVAHAHARLSRARSQLERSLGALLLARAGSAQQCPQLAELLRGWDGQLSVLLRKRIGRHVDGCGTCTASQRRQLAPAALFSAYSALPFLAAPAELLPRLQLTSFDPGHSGARQEVDLRTGRFRTDTGFPRPRDLRRRRRVSLTATAAAALVAAVAGGAIASTTLAGIPVSPLAEISAPALSPAPAAPTAAPAAAPGTRDPFRAPGRESGAGTPSPTGSPSAPAPPPPPAAPPPAPDPPPGPPPPPPPFTVAATLDPECLVSNQQLLLNVVAEASRPLQSGTLTVSNGEGTSSELPLEASGQQASGGGVVNLFGNMTWQVTVTDQDGNQAQTGQQQVPNPCPGVRVPG